MYQSAKLYFDGECPFCSRYVLMLRAREHLSLELINIRDHPDSYRTFLAAGLDLNTGMVLTLNGQHFHGSDCINRLALLTTPVDRFNRFNSWLFRRPRVASLIYPLLVASRNTILWLMRRRPLKG
jgi:predicted DCC family thiol-disulfide oxidoreductase YuxK